MFARGKASLHTPPLLGRKSFEAKSRVSTTSKLVENKRLQVLYSHHLRKTGGRGRYRLVHTAYLPLRKPRGTKFNHSRTTSLFPASLIIPAHTRHPGGGGYSTFVVAELQIGHSIGKSAGLKARRYIGESGMGREELAP